MKNTKRVFAAVISVLILPLLLCSCFRITQTDDIPDPTDDFYVYDEANVLDAETEEYIIGKNADLYEKCGGQIVVACVNTTGTTDIKDYAYTMFNKWGIGSNVRNNGVLILLSIDEDDYWVLQGEGLEDLIQSGTLKLMLDDNLEPFFAQKRYADGVVSLFNALINEYEQIYSVSVQQLPIDSVGEYVPESSDVLENGGEISVWKMISAASMIIVGFTIVVIVIITVISVAITVFIIIASVISAEGGTPFRGRINVNPHSYRPSGTFHGSGGFNYGGSFGGHHHGGFTGGSHGGGFHGGGFTGGSHGGGFSGGSHHSGGGGSSHGGGAGRR